MRNNKGFTMIELLAAIVILSILIGISIPIVAALLDNSRSKMYINDAKKLIAQADYKLRSSSSFIEKPDDGDCIIMTMAYLDTSEFDSSPNGGAYEKDSSFVVIKNNDGIMEYSVSVVEKLKGGGFKGLELVRKSELLSNHANTHIVSFNNSGIVNVGAEINKNYINSKLGNDYISSENDISAIYSGSSIPDE